MNLNARLSLVIFLTIVHREQKLCSGSPLIDFPHAAKLVCKDIAEVDTFMEGVRLCANRHHYRRAVLAAEDLCFREQFGADKPLSYKEEKEVICARVASSSTGDSLEVLYSMEACEKNFILIASRRPGAGGATMLEKISRTKEDVEVRLDKRELKVDEKKMLTNCKTKMATFEVGEGDVVCIGQGYVLDWQWQDYTSCLWTHFRQSMPSNYQQLQTIFCSNFEAYVEFLRCKATIPWSQERYAKCMAEKIAAGANS